MSNHSNKPNHLINETSPYLLQHAYNPVDWYPWGDEAFRKAKDENKLVFLSIGYATCHWCHVMAHESFEDQSVAKLLNDRFVCIKVDREERKDIDTIYMKACQAMTGSGGWPLNLWLTPDKLPVYAGTYFPKRSVANRPGFIEVCQFLAETFEEKPNALFNKAFEIITALKRAENHKEAVLEEDILEKTYEELAEAYDKEYGGFSKAPKFPVASQIDLMLESGNGDYLKMAMDTLKHMARGGLYDHIGGGFSRYSVDRYWMIPHFEKMLYDNGQLLDVYAKAYHKSRNMSFLQIINETIEFLKRELRDAKGGFYSALDADSEGVEGKFYRFTLDEVKKVLNPDSKYFIKAYNMTETGNFEGFNVPNLIGKTLDVMQDEKLKTMKKSLFDYREKRVHPGLDDKILSMSNGYVIHGLCSVYKYTEVEEAKVLATQAYQYIKEFMMSKDGRLLSSVRHHKGNIDGSIDDYASVIRAQLALYDVTFQKSYLDDAIAMTDKTLKLFWDEEHGGFFVGENGNRELIYNPKEVYDGATPSGNSMMALSLMKLFLHTDDLRYKARMDELVEGFAKRFNDYKHFASYGMAFLKAYISGTKEVKLFVADEETLTLAIKSMLSDKNGYMIRQVSVDASRCLDGKPTIYKCENGACDKPEIIDLKS